MYAQLIAVTNMIVPIDWKQERPDEALALVERAGRECYQSWNNPSGRSTDEYIDNLIHQGHLSVLEHVTISFELECSRSVSHELVRHRHFSFSQESTRYVAYNTRSNSVGVETPPLLEVLSVTNEELLDIMGEAIDQIQRLYNELLDLSKQEIDRTHPELPAKTRKQAALSIARTVLPQGMTTHLVMTGNLRAWLEFLARRGARAADPEMRELASAIREELVDRFPVFDKYFETHVDEFGIPFFEVKEIAF